MHKKSMFQNQRHCIKPHFLEISILLIFFLNDFEIRRLKFQAQYRRDRERERKKFYVFEKNSHAA